MRALSTFALEIQRGEDHEPSRVSVVLASAVPDPVGLALVTSSILFISSLRFLPVAEATATSFAAPIFITALSVPLLGEKVGLRRWIATSVGLLGVLVVVRPETSGFQPAFILPLLAALGWASAVVVTRRTSAADDALTTLSDSAVIG